MPPFPVTLADANNSSSYDGFHLRSLERARRRSRERRSGFFDRSIGQRRDPLCARTAWPAPRIRSRRAPKTRPSPSGTEEEPPRGSSADTPSGRVPHPAPRIKVDVLKLSGRINEADVLRQARSKGYWPFRLCYEEGLRRSQKLHGTVHVRVTVGASGAVRGAQKVAAEVDDPTVVGCVVKAARGLRFPRPSEERPR